MRIITNAFARSRTVATMLAVAGGIIATAQRAHAQAGSPGAAPPTGKSAGRYADVNGLHLYYEIHGDARPGRRPLVLLHGGLGAIEMFGPNLDALAQGRQVIAVDLQGHGRTADIDRPIRVQLMADDIAALLEQLHVDRADVMGYSLGGGVALLTAIRHPDVVGKLVVVSTNFRRDAFYPDILAQQAQVNANIAEQMKQTPMYQMYASLAPRPQDFGRLLSKMGEAMKQDFDFSADIPRIKARTMVVCGDADIFPPSHAVEMFRLLGGGLRDGGWDGSGRPASRLAILPGLTHYTIFAAPALAAAVIPFLDEPDGAAH